MAEATAFLTELEDAVSRGTAESRLRALWHATDCLISGSYSEEQIWAFGEIIGRLAQEIEVGARVRLANELAPSKNAPIDVVMRFRCSQRSPMASCRKSLRSAPTGSCLARRSASAACFSSPDSLRSICCPKQTGDRHGGAARLALKFRRPLPTTSIVLPH